MHNIFEMPHYAAADYLEEHGYPALGELFRHTDLKEPSELAAYDNVQVYPRGYRDLMNKSGVRVDITHPYVDVARSYKRTDGSYHISLGKKGAGYWFTGAKGIPKDLHDRIVSELTDKTELARRELPEVSDDQFSPVKGLGGGLKSRFTSGEHTYETRFDKAGLDDHHIFSFEQLTAKPDQDEYGITGAGNALHTLKHVAARFIHGLRLLKPTKVTFSAEEPSRQKLYDAMVKHLPQLAPEYLVSKDKGRYTVARKMELAKGWEGDDLGIQGDDYPTHPEGFIDEDGNYHANEPGPYGFRHDDTLKRLGYKNTGEANRAGLMHLGSMDGVQLLGHRSDRGYTLPQLRKLKTLASEAKLEPAITTTQNGVVSTRSLKLARPGAHGLISPEGVHHPLGMHGLQSHDNLARQLGHKDALDAQAKGFMHVSSDFEHNLIGHNEGRKYHLEQLKTLKRLARDHGYLGAGVTEGNNTRMLKLSSADRLWEVAHEDPDARLILADHLEENGEPELAKFMRMDLKPHTSDFTYRPDSMGVVGPNGKYEGYDIQHPHIYRFMGGHGYAYLKTKHMGDKEFLRADDVPPHLVDNIAKEIESHSKMELARAKAPEGGMVSNNQFYPGGRFLPRALKSIREVRNRKLSALVKLSRENVRDLLHAWRPYEENDQRHLIAADQLEESDSPAAPLAEFLRNAKPGLPTGPRWNIPVLLNPVRQPSTRDPELRREINEYRRPRLAARLKSLEDPESGFHRVYFHHDPETNSSHIIALIQTGPRAYTWHAPATKEQLQALGAKSKRMKLSSEHLWENMAAEPDDPTHRLILADHLEEHGEAPLAEFLRHEKTKVGKKWHKQPVTHKIYDLRAAGSESWALPLKHPSIEDVYLGQSSRYPGKIFHTWEFGGNDVSGHIDPELADKIKEHLMSPA